MQVMKYFQSKGCRLGGLLLLLGLLWGCSGGAVSAPPVSLPAPVTGRITVSSPDEDGEVTIEGDEGAVSESAFVLAINETEAQSAFLTFPFSFQSVSAEGEGFHSICNEVGHACIQADVTGAFSMTIAASIDDSIAVVEFDNDTGFEKSERLRKPVPENAQPIKRPPVDVEVNESADVVYVYQQAMPAAKVKVEEDQQGQLTIIDRATDKINQVDLPTTGTGQIELDSTGNYLVMTDVVNGSVYIGQVNTTSWTQLYSLEQVGAFDIAFTSTGQNAVIGTLQPETPLLIVDVVSGEGQTTGNNFRFGGAPGSSRNIGGLDFATLEGVNIGCMVGRHQNLQGTKYTAISTLTDDGEDIQAPPLGTFSSFDQTRATGLFFDGATTSFHDVKFFNKGKNIMVTDPEQDLILIFDVELETTSVTSNGMSVQVTNALLSYKGAVSDPQGLVVDPREIEIDEAAGYAFVVVWNHTDEQLDSVVTIDLASLTVLGQSLAGLQPQGIDWDPLGQKIYIAGQKSHTLVVHSLADLLP